MKFELQILLKVLLLSFFAVGIFSIASVSLAETPTPTSANAGCDSETRDCAVEAVRSDGRPLTNVTGLNTCAITAAPASTCGFIASGSGSLPWFTDVTYTDKDTIKCSNTSLIGISSANDCVVTRSDGTYTGFHDPTDGILDTKVHDASGNIIKSDSSGFFGRANNQLTESVLSGVRDTASAALDGVAAAILTFANLMLAMAGTLLNWVVVKAVFQFGSVMGNSPGLLIAWGILRDIGNMLLLFGFIFMGLATILDLHSFPTKKAIPRLLIFAVLMNFSLFAAEAVIDVANTLSATVYAQANTDTCNGGEIGTAVNATVTFFSGSQEDCAINYGIAGHIMQSTGLSSVFKVPKNATFTNTVAVYLGLALFATIGAVVLFAAAIMLSIRLIVLTFLMVVSPIGFAGMAIPPLQRFASDWWSRLIHQAFFAPILFILIFVSLKVTDSFANTDSRQSLAGALTQPSSSVMGIVMVFAIVIGFMVASIVVANKFGAAGAAGAISMSKKIVLGTMGGVSGYAGRRVIGGSSASLQKRYESYLGTSPRARSILLGTGLDSAVQGALKKGQNAKFGSSKSYAEDKKHHKEREQELEKAGRTAANAKAVRDALAAVDGAAPDDKAAAEANLATILNRLTDAERAELDEIKKGTGRLDVIARSLSPEAFKKIMDNKDITDDRKNKMRIERFKGIAETIRDSEANPGDETKRKAAEKIIGQLTKGDIAQLAQTGADPANTSAGPISGILTSETFAGNLSDDMFKKIKEDDNGSLTRPQREQMETSRNKRLSDPLKNIEKVKTMNNEAISKLKSDVLKEKSVLEAMGVRKVFGINPEKIGNDDHLDEIKDFINDKLMKNPDWRDSWRNYGITNPKNKKMWENIGVMNVV